MPIMYKTLEPTYNDTPKSVDEIKNKNLLNEQMQRKQAIKERIAKYMKLGALDSKE